MPAHSIETPSDLFSGVFTFPETVGSDMADQDFLIEDMRATITDLMALCRAQHDRLQDLQGGRKPPPSDDSVVFLAPKW